MWPGRWPCDDTLTTRGASAARSSGRRRAEGEGPAPADYDRPDTVASLAMGVGALVAPLVAPRLLRHVTPGRGRYGRALVGTAIAAVAVTTVADRLAREPGAAG